jgi:hypothetical protein
VARWTEGFSGLAARLPVLLLVLLGLTQVALTHTHQLSPWKGGGFGMFSTNDHGGLRVLHAYTLGEGGEARLRLPDELRRKALVAREIPTEARLGRLAEALAAGAPTADRVRVEVWRLEFDGELRPSLRRIAVASSGPSR